VAAASVPPWPRQVRLPILLQDRLEAGSYLGDEQTRLLERRKVPACTQLVVMTQVGIASLTPSAGAMHTAPLRLAPMTMAP